VAVSKEDLLRAKVGEHTHVIEGVGEVRYRGLTRGEALKLQGKQMSTAEMDCKLLAIAVIEPKLSEAEWAEVAAVTSAGLLESLSTAIAAASGMRKADAKAAYATFRDD
jgi:hypothetical protein